MACCNVTYGAPVDGVPAGESILVNLAKAEDTLDETESLMQRVIDLLRGGTGTEGTTNNQGPESLLSRAGRIANKSMKMREGVAMIAEMLGL